MEVCYFDIVCFNLFECYQDVYMFCGKVEEVEKYLFELVDVFFFFMVCINYSCQGKIKKKLVIVEMGDEVILLFGVVEMICVVNFVVMFFENVFDVMGFVIYELLKKELLCLGYVCYDMIFDQFYSGVIDCCCCYWMVVYSKGLNVNVESFMLVICECIYQIFGEFMEDLQGDGVWYDVVKL